MGDGWAYRYDAHQIRGFKQTHQPSPWINDYGQFAIMPVRDASAVDQDRRASRFSHKSETARPYYYQVYLADHDINAEIAPTERADWPGTYCADSQCFVERRFPRAGESPFCKALIESVLAASGWAAERSQNTGFAKNEAGVPSFTLGHPSSSHVTLSSISVLALSLWAL